MSERLLLTDWVDCPVCGGTDMRRETKTDIAEGEKLTPEDKYTFIYCVNTQCGSNGGEDFSATSCDCDERFDDHVCPEPTNHTWADVGNKIVDNVFTEGFFWACLILGPGVFGLIKALMHV